MLLNITISFNDKSGIPPFWKNIALALPIVIFTIPTSTHKLLLSSARAHFGIKLIASSQSASSVDALAVPITV